MSRSTAFVIIACIGFAAITGIFGYYAITLSQDNESPDTPNLTKQFPDAQLSFDANRIEDTVYISLIPVSEPTDIIAFDATFTVSAPITSADIKAEEALKSQGWSIGYTDIKEIGDDQYQIRIKAMYTGLDSYSITGPTEFFSFEIDSPGEVIVKPADSYIIKNRNAEDVIVDTNELQV